MKPALVTDSNSQLPQVLRERFDVEVVPITVVINGREFREGIDIDSDEFYAFFADGATPDVSTSQPSPGEFVEAYQRCVDRGHDEIVSIHITESLSGTLNSARVAADLVDASVRLVDSGTASFGISCCVWQAGLARATESANAATMVEAAEATADKLHSVTALGAADLLSASGRVDVDIPAEGIPLFTTGPGGAFDAIGSAKDEDQVCDMLAGAMHHDGHPIRVALGMADAATLAFYERLESRLNERDDVVEVLRYRIGPSVGALTGPGTAGGFWYRATE